jgi:hypothetical protein
MVIGAFGKTSQQAKEAMNLRKSIRPTPSRTAKTTTPTTPNP